MVEGLGLSLSTLRLSGTDKQKLKDACREVESMFLYMMLKEMDKTLTHNDLFSGGEEQKVFLDLKNIEMSRKLSNQSVLGMGDLLYKSMEKFV